jgi:hypothetical protein
MIKRCFFRFHCISSDYYLTFNDADPRGLRVENLLGSLKKLEVSYFFGKINGLTDIMIREFRKVMKDENFVKEIDMESPDNIFPMALQSVYATIDGRIPPTFGAR